MRVTLDAVTSAVAAEVGLDPDNVSSDKLKIYRFINDTRREIASLPYHFKSLEFTGELVQSLWVTAGTVKATQDRSEITGTSTSWTTAMSNWYIKVGSQTEYQRLAYVTDTTHATLETAWQGDSVTADAYKLYKRFYELPPKVDKVLRIKNPETDNLLALYEPQEFYERYQVLETFGTPEVYTQFGSTDLGLEYLTSTVYTAVTSTANSPILHFSSAFLTTAMFPGDRIRLGDSTTSTAFYVDSIISSSIVALRSYVGISSAALSATAFSLNRPLLEFYPAINGRKVMRYQAQKNIVDLVNGEDWMEDGWYPVIKAGAIAKAMGYINSPKEQQKLLEYEAKKADLIRAQAIALNPAPRLKPFIPKRYGQAFGTLLGSDRYER